MSRHRGAGADPNMGGAGAGAGSEAGYDSDDVVDADYKEV